MAALSPEEQAQAQADFVKSAVRNVHYGPVSLSEFTQWRVCSHAAVLPISPPSSLLHVGSTEAVPPAAHQRQAPPVLPRYLHASSGLGRAGLASAYFLRPPLGAPPRRASPVGHTFPPSPGWPAPCGCSWHIPRFEPNLVSFENDQNRIQILKDLITEHTDQMKFTELIKKL